MGNNELTSNQERYLMKKRMTALLAGLVLASGMSAVSAADVPEILGNSDYQAMNSQEMGAVQGEAAVSLAFSNAGAAGVFFAGTATATNTTAVSGFPFGPSFAGSTSASASTAF